MNCKCNITVIIAFAYVIIYLVVRIYENPRFEYFEESANSAETLFHEPQIVNIDPRGNHIGVTFNRPQGATGLAKYMLFLKDENNNRILEKMILHTCQFIINLHTKTIKQLEGATPNGFMPNPETVKRMLNETIADAQKDFDYVKTTFQNIKLETRRLKRAL